MFATLSETTLVVFLFWGTIFDVNPLKYLTFDTS